MQKTCRQCSAGFEITSDDLAFYEKVSPVFHGKRELITPPTLCPDCRTQRRLTFRNERSLYHRKCDFTGRQIISVYSQEKPYKVYDHHDWYSDKWDALDYGKDFDFSRPFFEQFAELQMATPLLSLILQANNENCEYTNLTSNNRNGYLIFAASDNEDCYYSTYIQRNKDILDCLFTFDSEKCYECSDCDHCYNVTHSQFCQNCNTSAFLDHCTGCTNCFGCVSLVNKKYHIFNEPYSPEEYEKKVQEAFSNPSNLTVVQKVMNELKQKMPRKYYDGNSNEQVTGDHISHSRNVENCFDCTNLENCKNCIWLHQSRDCQDCYAWGLSGELGYENHLCGNNFYNVRFSDSCWNDVSDLLYCKYCTHGNKHLFGCVSLHHKEYCIFNKQYSKEEYETLAPKIIEHMRKTGEWGEFFPASLSTFGYNESIAQEYFPLSKEEVENRGWKWRDNEKSKENYLGPKIEIPDNIHDVSDDFCQKILLCEATGKTYKIIPQELQFYREMHLPIPRICPEQRHKTRLATRNPRKLWTRECAKCQNVIHTTFAPERPEIVYCESCYLEAVY